MQWRRLLLAATLVALCALGARGSPHVRAATPAPAPPRPTVSHPTAPATTKAASPLSGGSAGAARSTPRTAQLPAQSFVRAWGENGGNGAPVLEPIGGIGLDRAGNLYVTDSGNFRIMKFTSAGAYVTQWGSPARAPASSKPPPAWPSTAPARAQGVNGRPGPAPAGRAWRHRRRAAQRRACRRDRASRASYPPAEPPRAAGMAPRRGKPALLHVAPRA